MKTIDSGLEDAWNEVASQLRGYIRTQVSDHMTAEDLLQDVFLKAQKRAGQLQSIENISAWLFRIARNVVIDHRRTAGARANRTVALPESLELVTDEDQEPPECELKLRAAFRGMVSNLPEPYREALRLTEYEGLSQKELASRLGISFSGAKSRVQRGREKLKETVLKCCALQFDRRGNVIGCEPKKNECEC